MNARNWMKIDTTTSQAIPASSYTAEFASISHVDGLGSLMFSAYHGTIDYEGETLEQCTREVGDTLAGKYGPLVKEASFIIQSEGKIISASLVTHWKGKPLLAYSMTDPTYQRQGLAGFLILKSADALKRSGLAELLLVVTEGNPAEQLYTKLGFKKLGAALPQQPPPAAP